MSRPTIKRITAILTRLLYLLVASVLLVALLTTLERGLPHNRLTLPSQAADLHRTDEGTWTIYTTANSGLAANYVLSIAVEGGNLWFGTNQGVSVFDGENWTTYSTADGLVNKIVNAIAIDEQGNKWFGTYNWVSKLNDGGTPHNKSDDVWTTYDSSHGLPFKNISAVARGQAGTMWFGTKLVGYSDKDGYGVCKFSAGRCTNYLGDKAINAIAVDHSGNVWVGTYWDGVYKYDGSTWTQYTTGLASNHVQAVYIDSADVKWFGGCIYAQVHCPEAVCVNSVVSRFDGGWGHLYPPAGTKVTAIAIDWQENKWFGTDEGICKLDGTGWTCYSKSDIPGLEVDFINTIAVDNQGNVWFGTHGGGVIKYGYETSPPTPTPTATPTETPTRTSTPTLTPTPTQTGTPGPTPTPTYTGTPTSTPTDTPTPTPSGTPTPPPTVTPTPTATNTPWPWASRAFLPFLIKQGLPCGWNDPDDNEPGNDLWKSPDVPYGSGLFADRTFWSLTQPADKKGNDPDWFKWRVDWTGTHWLWIQARDPSDLRIWLLVAQDTGGSLVSIAWGESYGPGQLGVELIQGEEYYVLVSNLTPSKVGCYSLWLQP